MQIWYQRERDLNTLTFTRYWLGLKGNTREKLLSEQKGEGSGIPRSLSTWPFFGCDVNFLIPIFSTPRGAAEIRVKASRSCSLGFQMWIPSNPVNPRPPKQSAACSGEPLRCVSIVTHFFFPCAPNSGWKGGNSLGRHNVPTWLWTYTTLSVPNTVYVIKDLIATAVLTKWEITALSSVFNHTVNE